MDLLNAPDSWSWLLALCLWVFWVLALMGLVILAFAVLVGFVRGVRGWYAPKHASKPLLERAKAEAVVRNQDQSYRHGFVDGAEWWSLHHK